MPRGVAGRERERKRDKPDAAVFSIGNGNHAGQGIHGDALQSIKASGRTCAICRAAAAAAARKRGSCAPRVGDEPDAMVTRVSDSNHARDGNHGDALRARESPRERSYDAKGCHKSKSVAALLNHGDAAARRDHSNPNRLVEARARARAVSGKATTTAGECGYDATWRHEPDAVVPGVSHDKNAA